MDIYANFSTGKPKPRQFSLIRLQFAHRANGSLSFVHLFTKEQTSVCNRTKCTKQTCRSITINNPCANPLSKLHLKFKAKRESFHVIF